MTFHHHIVSISYVTRDTNKQGRPKNKCIICVLEDVAEAPINCLQRNMTDSFILYIPLYLGVCV